MISGIWIPLITPFRDGAIDLKSYRRLIDHYVGCGISGLFPLGTTGEAPTLDDAELDAVIAETVDAVAGRVPVFVGIGGNATHKVIGTIRRFERHGFDGIVSVCPYYNRPAQDGLRQHFTAISEATDRAILIYNIPYRTSVNLANETLLRLTELANIVGVKDSAGSMVQSLELLANRPRGFSILTGEDHLLLPLLCSGADGGILASGHLATERFVEIARLMAANDHRAARAIWSPLQRLIAKLFEEPNPMPLKHCLWRQGLIASPECRLPLTAISAGLRTELDNLLSNFSGPASAMIGAEP
jgi:4-hydroxy-tetrahydrodipicolinate synthase